jgi:hypothetical protein
MRMDLLGAFILPICTINPFRIRALQRLQAQERNLKLIDCLCERSLHVVRPTHTPAFVLHHTYRLDIRVWQHDEGYVQMEEEQLEDE